MLITFVLADFGVADDKTFFSSEHEDCHEGVETQGNAMTFLCVFSVFVTRQQTDTLAEFEK